MEGQTEDYWLRKPSGKHPVDLVHLCVHSASSKNIEEIIDIFQENQKSYLQ
jgi:hypothetical protein